MSFEAVVAALGLLVLIALAVVIGLAQGRAEELARRRIARHRRELWEWERELIAAAESRGCASCKLLRERAELHDHY